MNSYMRALALAQALTDVLEPAGIRAVVDARNAVPPALLVTPPGRRGDVHGGFTCEWKLLLILPAARWDPDVWATADQVLALLEPVLPIDRADPIDPNDETPMCGLRITFEEAS
jgi:hypothetical protein